MGKINAAWHRAHRMPPNATLDERIAWHVEHAANCGCREIPASLREAMTRRGITVPASHDDEAGESAPAGSRGRGHTAE